ncbi:MAG TPA: hypothetical protein VF556_14055 [Pyrinomonadaceae bacterium]
MNVSFKDFSSYVPDKERYERGVDYLCHDLDLEFEDAFYLIKTLKHNHSSIAVYTPSAVVSFFIFDNALHVQIDGDSTWAASDLDLNVAKEILRVAWEGCEDFGSQIPGTNQEWGAYFL